MDAHLERLGLAPHVSDADLARAYEEIPAPEKGVIKNAVAMAHTLNRGWAVTTECAVTLGSAVLKERARPAAFALFLYHPERFPLPALASAITLALVARVPHVAVVAQAPWDRAFLFVCDFLSVSWIYSADVDVCALAAALEAAGQGVVVDLGLGGLPTPLTFRPEAYPVVDTLAPSPQSEAYARIFGKLRHTDPSLRPRWYVAYSEDSAIAARFVLSPRLLGGWPWDRLGPEDFLVRTTTFS